MMETIESRMTDNLIAPLTMPHVEAIKFTRHHVCAVCLGSLSLSHVSGDTYLIECPVCGPAHNHSVIKAAIKDNIETTAYLTRQKMYEEDRKPRPEADILKELGF